MAVERYNNNSKVIEERKGKVRSWTDLSSLFSGEINPHHRKFLRQYFRMQLRIAEGREVKATEISRGLNKKKGFMEFEMRNQPLLAAIDIVVRGSTNRKIAKPSFEIIDN